MITALGDAGIFWIAVAVVLLFFPKYRKIGLSMGAAMVLVILALFLRNPLVNLTAHAAAYALMFWAIFRTFSRNTYRRYQENRKFLMLLDRIKDRKHKHFSCPKCHRPMRVPRGKGKIAITCPKCGERFIRKS